MIRDVRVAVCTALTLGAAVAFIAVLGVSAVVGPPMQSAYAAAETTAICHKPGTSEQKTLVVASSAVPGHLGHGDALGPCSGTPPTTTPPTNPPTTTPTTTASTTPTTTTSPTSPGTPPTTVPPDEPDDEPDTTAVVVEGASTVRTDASELGRAFIAGEDVHIEGNAPAGCRPVLRVDGRLVGRVAAGPSGNFDVSVATDSLAAGRHVAEVVCTGDVAGVVARKVFWIAAPLTSSAVFSVGMLSTLTLGALGWVGIRTLRDSVSSAAPGGDGHR